MKGTVKKPCAAAPLPCRGGAGVGSVMFLIAAWLLFDSHKYTDPTPYPSPTREGSWLRASFDGFDFLKWTHSYNFLKTCLNFISESHWR